MATWLTNSDPKDKVNILVSGGGAISMEDLQFNASVEPDEDFSASALISLNANGRLQAGLVSGTHMPMWAINGAQDYDSNHFKTGMIKAEDENGQGSVNALVAVGGYELAVTEYNNTDYDSTDYGKGGTLLTDDTVTAGYVKPVGTYYSDATVVGCVSTGIQSTANGLGRARYRLGQKALLHFWTMFLPPVATAG